MSSLFRRRQPGTPSGDATGAPAAPAAPVAAATDRFAPFAPELSLRDLIFFLVHGWPVVVGTVLAVMIGTMLWMSSAAPRYTISMVVAPVVGESVTGSGGGKLLEQFGLGGGDSTDNPFNRYSKTFGSVPVVEALQRHDIIKLINQSQWDDVNQEWIRPAGLKADLVYWLREVFNVPGWQPPSVLSTVRALGSQINIAELDDGPYLRISMTTQYPETAVRVLGLLHQETNALLARRAREQDEAKIVYLRDRLSRISVQDHRQVLTSLLARTEQSLMLSGSTGVYAAETLIEPSLPDLPSRPQPVLFLKLALAGGLVLGIFLALLYGILRRP